MYFTHHWLTLLGIIIDQVSL